MSEGIDLQKVAARVAQRLRAIVVKETVPFKTGELRKSIHVSRHGSGYIVGTNKVYARAVHEGRKAMVIRPKNAKALRWQSGRKAFYAKKVFQPARKGKPFFREAVDTFEGNLDNEVKSLEIPDGYARQLAGALKAKGLQVKVD